MPMIFAAISDDVTGGMELAAVLAGQGIDCGFVTNPARLDPSREAVVMAQKSRTCAPERALELTRASVEAAKRAGARQIFYKYCATFDSTPQGNIGPCADLIADAVGARQVLFAPSFPEVERYVFQGHLFVKNQLVSNSPKRFDPLTPMLEPDLVAVLQPQTPHPVGLLPLPVLLRGQDAAREHLSTLQAAGVRHVIADAISDADLRALAQLSWAMPLMTGNSTIAGFYPAVWRAQGLTGPDPGPPDLPGIDAPAVVLAGSCAERTLEQLMEFGRSRPVIRVSPQEAAAADLAPGLIERVLPLLADGPVAIATSAPPDEVRQAQAALGVAGAAAASESLLGRLAAGFRRAGVGRFLIAGGETSGAILGHLGVEEMTVGRYEAAGIGRAVSIGDRPVALCLKSGKLGPVDMFLPVLESMRRGGRSL